MQVLYGLLGRPVGHSISPPMVNAAFRELGFDAHYTAFNVLPDDFEIAVKGLVALRAGGVNVTIPHKQRALQMASFVSAEAKLAGAVNTLKFVPETGEILGHNTDVSGWWTSLVSRSGGQTKWAKVVLLGAGGAARAVLAAFVLHAAQSEIWIASRDVVKSEGLRAEFSASLEIHTLAWEDKERQIADAELVVNSTPVGMWPHTEPTPVVDVTCFAPGQVVYDLIYRPLRTRFLFDAQERGARVIDGLSMLVEQGALAVEYWTGKPAPRDRMLQAAREALNEQTLEQAGSHSV